MSAKRKIGPFWVHDQAGQWYVVSHGVTVAKFPNKWAALNFCKYQDWAKNRRAEGEPQRGELDIPKHQKQSER